jgi:hypothetical protein
MFESCLLNGLRQGTIYFVRKKESLIFVLSLRLPPGIFNLYVSLGTGTKKNFLLVGVTLCLNKGACMVLPYLLGYLKDESLWPR